MFERIVAWSLHSVGTVAAIAFIGHTYASHAWSVVFGADDESSFPFVWLGVSCVVGGIVVAFATVFLPDPAQLRRERAMQLGACALLVCLGAILTPFGFLIDIARMLLP